MAAGVQQDPKHRQQGREYLVMTPDEAVAEIKRRTEGMPVDYVQVFGDACGMPESIGDHHGELLAKVVAPALKHA